MLQVTLWTTPTLSTLPPMAPSCGSRRSSRGLVGWPCQFPGSVTACNESLNTVEPSLARVAPVPPLHCRFPPPLAAEETLAAAESLRDEPPTSFLDRVFDNEINIALARTRKAYDRMLFREALKTGWWVGQVQC